MAVGFYVDALSVYNIFLTEQVAARVPTEYKQIAEALLKKVGWKTQITATKNSYKIPNQKENKKVYIALSSGLDSVYLLYKLLESGYDVTAVHIMGMNKSSSQYEAIQAGRIAQEAGVKIKKVIFRSPKQAFPDNPFKNQLILSMMLEIGCGNNCYRYAIGSDWNTPLSEAVPGYTITDSSDVYREYWSGVKTHFPQAELIFINDTEPKYKRLQYMAENHMSALNEISSCIAPQRFRKHWHDINRKKYSIELMKGRCGSCYKCSMEYILLVEAGYLEKNEEYYDHCLHILANSKTSHRPDLFDARLPIEQRIENLKRYGS